MINTFIFFLIFLFCKSAISEDIDQRIRQYLLENPEVIIKSLENYEIRMMEEERKKNNEIIKKKKRKLFLIQVMECLKERKRQKK